MNGHEILDKADNNLLVGRGTAPKDVVDPKAAARRIRLAAHPPAPALAPFVDYFWIVEWDMTGRAPETQRVLPYPNAHLVFEAGHSAVHGVVRGAYDKVVTGTGRVLGVRFKPGGLRPFISQPLSSFTDRTLAVGAVLGVAAIDAERRVLSQPDDVAMVAQAEAMLLEVLPAHDSQTALASRLVAAAAVEHGPVNVGQLCAQMDIGERALQRLFGEYVGVTPKWVLQRYRLQEATWRLARPDCPELAAVAQALGFFDQAHFTRAFGKLVGMSPLDYKKSQQP